MQEQEYKFSIEHFIDYLNLNNVPVLRHNIMNNDKNDEIYNISINGIELTVDVTKKVFYFNFSLSYKTELIFELFIPIYNYLYFPVKYRVVFNPFFVVDKNVYNNNDAYKHLVLFLQEKIIEEHNREQDFEDLLFDDRLGYNC